MKNKSLLQFALILMPFLCAWGCDSSKPLISEPADVVEVKEPGVLLTAPNTESLWLEVLDERPITRVVVGQSTPVFYQVDTSEVFALENGEVSQLPLEASVVLPSVSSAIRAPTGEILIAHIDGLSVLTNGELLPSPLNEVMGGEVVSDLALTEDMGIEWLWLATESGLLRWFQGSLERVVVDDFSTNLAKLAWGPAIRNGPALWVVSEGDFYALDSTTAGWSAWEGHRDCAARDIGVNQELGLWLYCDDAIRYRNAQGQWYEAITPSPISQLHTNPQSASSWLVTSDNRIWHAHDDLLWPVNLDVQINDLAVGASGELLIASEQGLLRARPGRSIIIENMPTDGVLVTERVARLVLEGAEVISEVALTLNGSPVEFIGDTYEFTLDGPMLAEGEHLLEVSVSYSDTDQVSDSRAYFSVFHPSWERDIRPISLFYCDSCHGIEAAVSLKLQTYSNWVLHAEDIVGAVESNLMPPGVPLDDEQLNLIRYWNEASRPE